MDRPLQKKLLNQLIEEGSWKSLFPKTIFDNLINWFEKQESEVVVVRFTFIDKDTRKKAALHLECLTTLKNNNVQVIGVYTEAPNIPLALTPKLYNLPLYCMPGLLENLLKKKK